jgi:hypothetical protein
LEKGGLREGKTEVVGCFIVCSLWFVVKSLNPISVNLLFKSAESCGKKWNWRLRKRDLGKRRFEERGTWGLGKGKMEVRSCFKLRQIGLFYLHFFHSVFALHLPIILTIIF